MKAQTDISTKETADALVVVAEQLNAQLAHMGEPILIAGELSGPDRGVILVRDNKGHRRVDQHGARMDHSTHAFRIHRPELRLELFWGHYDMNWDAAVKDFASRRRP